VLHLPVLGLCLFLARVAQAGVPVTAPQPIKPPPAPLPVEYDDYRLTLLGVDVAAVSMLVGAAYLSQDGTSAAPLALAGFGAYAFGGPVVHLVHEQPSRALGSLGLRLGLPLAGLLTGAALIPTCPSGDAGVCTASMLGIGILLAGGGALAAMIIDDTVLGYAPKASPEYQSRRESSFLLAVAPLLEPRRKTSGLSLVGAF
jgi:hypothetical protein